MSATPCRSFVPLAVLFAFLIPACDLIADQPITPTSIRPTAGTAERAATPKTIRWSVLAPENGRPFNDPFAKLSQKQLSDLSYVVRVQRLIAEEKIKADGVDAKEAAELARKLTSDGVDIGWLMVQRERVKQIRGLQVESLSRSIAEGLGDQQVTLTGYVMPIKVGQQRLTEFFLVPTSATCSNEAAPSPLQAVFVSTEQGIELPKKGIAMRVTGRVKAQPNTRTVRNGIGLMAVQSAYTMLSPQLEVYAQTVK
jgi:hypothetical protein